LGEINKKNGVESLSLKFGNPVREICVSAGNENEKEEFIADIWAVQYYEGLIRCQEALGQTLAKKANSTRGNLQQVLKKESIRKT